MLPLAGRNPDVVFILTDETRHVPIARELLQYGVKRLFIEKPFQAANGQANVTEQDFFDARDLLLEARWTQYAASFEHSLEAYFDTLRNGEAPPVSGLDGLAELQFEAALNARRRPGKPSNSKRNFP